MGLRVMSLDPSRLTDAKYWISAYGFMVPCTQSWSVGIYKYKNGRVTNALQFKTRYLSK